MSHLFSRVAERVHQYIVDVKIKSRARHATELWKEYTDQQNPEKGLECIRLLKGLQEKYGYKALKEVSFDESDHSKGISTSETWPTLPIAHDLFGYALNHPDPDMRQVPIYAVEEGVFKMTDVIQRKWHPQSTSEVVTIEESVFERFAVSPKQEVYEYFVSYAKKRPEVVQSVLTPSDLKRMDESGGLKAAEKHQGLTLLRAWYMRDLLKEPARLQYFVPHFRGDVGGEDEKEIELRGYQDWVGVRYPNPEKSIADLPEFLRRVDRELGVVVRNKTTQVTDMTRMARIEAEAYKKIAAIHYTTAPRIINGRWLDLGMESGWFTAQEVKVWLEEMDSQNLRSVDGQNLWSEAFSRGMAQWQELPFPKNDMYKTKVDGLVLKELSGTTEMIKKRTKTL
jgi:hypothetical protein